MKIKTAKLSIAVAGLIAICASPSHAAPVCLFGGVRCFVACGHPPSLANPSAAEHFLRTDRYDKITGLDRWSALLTTPLGKCLGINGWKRYHFRVAAAGNVIQAVTSWDGLRTVDLKLEELDGQVPNCPGNVCYIRAEVVRHVWKHLDHVPMTGERVRIAGELHWDGHGFLEIHPERKTDIEEISSTVGRD